MLVVVGGGGEMERVRRIYGMSAFTSLYVWQKHLYPLDSTTTIDMPLICKPETCLSFDINTEIIKILIGVSILWLHFDSLWSECEVVMKYVTSWLISSLFSAKLKGWPKVKRRGGGRGRGFGLGGRVNRPHSKTYVELKVNLSTCFTTFHNSNILART